MGNRSSQYRLGLRTLTAVLALCCAGQGLAAEPQCRDDTVFIKGAWGSARFSVEVADEPDEMAKGLMFRESLPTSSGMLFVYDTPRRASFWMRNTLIPLDMLFITPQGQVQHIHPMAIPLDETAIRGGDGVLAVLEINGGLAEKLGIAEGSVLKHPAFADNDPLWPC